MSNEVFIQDSNQSILTNSTLTADGYAIVSGYGFQQISLIVNIKNAPTGTTPSIIFTIQEIDPGDKTTTINNPISTASIINTGIYIASINTTISGSLKVSWVIGGTLSPTFTGVYATVVAKATPSTQTISYVTATSTNGVSFGQVVGTASTLAALRATTYTEQSSGAQRSLKSSSVNDTSAGTGARTVIITYFDSTMSGPFTETVTLNGTSAVNTTNTNICFIEKMVVSTVGSGGANAGTISIFTTTAGGGSAFGSIGVGNIVSSVGDNRTLWAHHYVSNSTTASILTMTGGTNGNQSAAMFLRVASPTVANNAEIQVTESIATVSASGSSSFFRTSSVPLQIVGPARITQYLVPNGSATTFYGGFQYSEE